LQHFVVVVVVEVDKRTDALGARKQALVEHSKLRKMY
jgi:hypothetical protein